MDLLAHLENKVDAAIVVGGEPLLARLEEIARFVREIAEAALVAGDEVTLQQARQLAAKLGPFGFAATVSDIAALEVEQGLPRERNCPRCGQHFQGPVSPLDRVGTLLCEDCTRELLAGIRL
jgi:hypothetical protein